MDTELVRAFIVVSRTLSFTRAAEELGTTQPLLSRAMRRLEDIVGEQLFDRSQRRIRLTGPGTAFLAEAQDILDHVDRAQQQARAVGQGNVRTIRVGYLPHVHCEGVSRSIRRFRRTRPEVTLDFRLVSRSEQVAALRAGELDAGLLDGGVCDRRHLAWDAIGQNRLILAVPTEWGFDPSRPIDLSALKGRPFVLPDPNEVPNLHMMQMLTFTRASMEPNVLRYVHDIAEIRFLVSAGLCAAFVHDTSLLSRVDGIDFIPIRKVTSELALDIYVTWKPKMMSPLVRSFVDCLIEEAHIPEIVPTDGGFGIEWRKWSAARAEPRDLALEI